MRGQTGETTALYTGPAAPLSCLALSAAPSQDGGRILFAGCWDKCIWSWNARTRAPGRRLAGGHADFVKAVVTFALPSDSAGGGGARMRELLVSGGADAALVVWDVATGEKLFVLKGHVRGVLALAVDSFSLFGGGEENEGNDLVAGEKEEEGKHEGVVVFSASSDREIRRWRIGAAAAREIAPAGDWGERLLRAHETGVNALRFDGDADLWTASSDGSARRLVRARGWEADTVLEHGEYVRDVAIDEVGGWVVTACRDEDVRIWEAGVRFYYFPFETSLVRRKAVTDHCVHRVQSGKLHHTFSGHFEEVTALLLLPDQTLVSGSIDGTLRRWSLKHEDLRLAKEEEAKERKGDDAKEEPDSRSTALTEEEERELAELMEDSE